VTEEGVRVGNITRIVMATDHAHRWTGGAATDPDARATMSGVTVPSETAPIVQVAPEDDEQFVGVVTRTVSWVLDALAINVVAIGAGLGTELVLSIFPVSKDFASVLKPIAGAAYIVWCALYFVAFWSWTGQTLGARLMQIRLLTAKGGRVKPVRALVRWVGMNLAMLPLFAGFYPILFGRRGFPDWLAHTEVVEARQLSVAQVRRAATRSRRDAQGEPPPTISAGAEPSSSVAGDGGASRSEAPGASPRGT
jgi:uncharacterized RDD family membrane protein YckC